MLCVPALFSNGMVLQGEKPVQVWGESTSAQVTVSIQGKSVTTPVENGHFTACLPPLDFSLDETLTIVGDEVLTVDRVAIGEVWLAGGQSNMEFQMYYDLNLEEVLHEDRVDVRSFGVPEIACLEALEQFDYSRWGFWRTAETQEDLSYHSAVAFYFAKVLAQKTGHVVGIVLCTWGGTNCAPWVNPSYLEKCAGQWWIRLYEEGTAGASLQERKELYLNSPMSDRGNLFSNKISSSLLFGASRQQQERWMKQMPPSSSEEACYPPFQQEPGRLFEFMVKPLAPFGIKGVVWYQGESDSAKPEIYGEVLTALIRSWRDVWGETLPFYVVQLPSFEKWMGADGHAFPILRQQQQKVADTVERVFLVSTMDCGARWNIHPRHKRPVGERLGLLALKETYGWEIQAGFPPLDVICYNDGMISLSFKQTQGQLVWKEEMEGYSALTVTVNHVPCKDFWWEVSENQLIVGSNTFHSGDQVDLKFAQQGYDPVNIFTSSGFSLGPFEVRITL